MRILALHQEFKQNVNFPREVANLSVHGKIKTSIFIMVNDLLVAVRPCLEVYGHDCLYT